ncbi:MAG: bifunctional [glutamine synthetase] adenylyltransferase/[glutamine synthetase]-adenylyl-L-tyrosine phosphorylase, partial [Pseudomonadota bacterium]
PQTFFVRLTRDLARLLQEQTEDGYVFRVDLRLRPDPRSTQVAMSTEAALIYYENYGQNWERAAFIKARVIAGDTKAGEEFLSALQPFVWRKYLDYAAVADVHAMKRQIHSAKGFGAIAVAGHNIKLGRGGIREIEFFAQTQQLIAGGRQPELRGRQTRATLKRLAERGWITRETADEMSSAYVRLRTLEHRLQMVGDDQTQKLPTDPEALAGVARLAGWTDAAVFERDVRATLETVQQHYADLFEDVPTLSANDANLVFAGEETDPETEASLARMGFKDPAKAVGIVRAWHRGRYRSMASGVAREKLTDLQPRLLAALAETVDPDAALLGFDRLLSQLPAGVQLFSMLCAKPRLLDLIAAITGSAPRLARILARRRRVIDAVLDQGALSDQLPSRAALAAYIHDDLNCAERYEQALDRARVITAEQSFLVGVRTLGHTIDASEAGATYSDIAEVIINELSERARLAFEQQHGVVDGGAYAVVAMGKLGGREMTAASDLDLIVIYDAPEDARQSEGARGLPISQYYARFTQRLISALSAPTTEGALFDVDLRLRPSGQKGPVATRLSAFQNYQRSQAWTWEHMALTRARVVAGTPALVDAVTSEIGDILRQPRTPENIYDAARDMHALIHREKGSAHPWDLKVVKGGLIDVEFIAQTLQLIYASTHPACLSPTTYTALAALDREGLLGLWGPGLLRACDLYNQLTQVLRLCFDGPFQPDAAPGGLKDLLARTANLPTFAHVDAELIELQSDVARAFDDLVAARV